MSQKQSFLLGVGKKITLLQTNSVSIAFKEVVISNLTQAVDCVMCCDIAVCKIEVGEIIIGITKITYNITNVHIGSQAQRQHGDFVRNEY